MKDEAELCTIIKNSYCKENIMWKIPDPSGDYNKTIARPFDLFGTYGIFPVYIEAKFNNEFRAFDLQRVEDHQVFNLLKLKQSIPGSICIVAYGVKIPRKSRIYFFDIEYVYQRRITKENFLLKELQNLPYLEVEKGLIDPKEIRIITR